MNSALKPVLTTSSPQSNPPAAPGQLNKPSVHSQNAPTTYGQPSTHVSPSLVNLPHSNPAIAHSHPHPHPNPAHQANHFPLNVPNASQHYLAANATIPTSNHPVTSSGHTAPPSGGQNFSLNKNVAYPAGYQPNLGHPPNLNPATTQSLVAAQPPAQVSVSSADAATSKPQSNGTAEAKSPPKTDVAENHTPLLPNKEKPAVQNQQQQQQNQEEDIEPPQKSATAVLTTPKPAKGDNLVSEEAKAPTPTIEGASAAVNLSSAVIPATTSSVGNESSKVDSNKAEPAQNSNADTGRAEVPSVENTDAKHDAATPPKSKDKEKVTANNKPSTPRTPIRKARTPKPEGSDATSKVSKPESRTPTQKSPVLAKTKRTRIKTQPYQSPLPEIEIITKISSLPPKQKNNDEKLIVFFKNEFLAVRNSEGSFYVCQAVQNVYKHSPKIRIRWLSQDKNDKSGEVYTPDFYDLTDFDCILTNLNLSRIDKGKFRLPPAEKERTDSILKRSLAAEKGEIASPSLTEEHPDGIDVSLYKEESQLKKRKSVKRRASSPSKSPQGAKKAKTTPVRGAAKKSLKKTKRGKKMSELQPSAAASEARKAVAGRSDRVKRRNDTQNNYTKSSPVVDQKKARVLAKVARNTATSKTQPSGNSKVKKPVVSKVQNQAPKAPIKRPKRSTKK